MGLYKVMLVDDEEEVRQAIEKRINWEEIGFEVVAGAENGEDALEKAEKFAEKYGCNGEKNMISFLH